MSALVEASVDTLLRWSEHPADFVREVFEVEPDAWQLDVLEAFPNRQRLAMKACKGPGKTAVLAWLIWNFLVTRPHPKVAATAVTKDNLDDNLWTELAKWQKRSKLLEAAFQWTKTRIFNREHPETWWASARTWSRSASPEQQADTLAGLHADYLLFILDESGGIPDAVMAAAEGGLANVVDPTRQEAHIVQAGNPTHLEGPLYRACTSEARLWHVTEITSDPDSPKRTPRVSVQWAREQIEKYGRDNPWVLVNVFGQFPPSSINTLLGPDDVRAAMSRVIGRDQYEFAARVLGIDVARQGDDASVIFPRQGRMAFPPLVFRNITGDQGAGHVSRKWIEWDANAAFIDGSGGWATSWVDHLRMLGRPVMPVEFAGKPNDGRFYNKRAEILFEAAQWVKDGGCLPNVPELLTEMTAVTYTFRGDRFLCEDKDQVKQRIGRSTDYFDAFALTFAQPVGPRQSSEHRLISLNGRHRARDYDPRLELMYGPDSIYGREDYDPRLALVAGSRGYH